MQGCADPAIVLVSAEEGKKTFCLEAWRTRDKVLAWFSKGVACDKSAKLTFSPNLNKHMRDELHRHALDVSSCCCVFERPKELVLSLLVL
jgi:hypothetical protein